ncbi:hypothetical protein BDA96_09G183200 [Sorghum bicolor]|uniref:DUF630 domain-containing protein n=1 Tax=Sorghum bicolor TaxID=4558 RepID=A0A921QAU2_SORBI|nr:hypothetical protein BDA96_09G183200 [Sorghum bicolor]
MDMDEGKSPAGAAIAEDVMSRFSLDVSAGCGGRHSTLLDEYERLAFEAQLNRAIVLRRCYSEPSPVRLSAEHQQRPPPAAAGGGGGGARAPPPPRGAHDLPQGEAARRDGGGGRFWRLHEVVARWLEALMPVFRWLRSAWECRWGRKQQPEAARRPPPTMPRVQLMDYLR